jgi:UDP-N-acetylglucosamine acyltransferase
MPTLQMNNKIHPTAIIEGDVQMGHGNEIGPYSIIIGPTKIGNGNVIGPHVTIGTPGQDTRDPHHDSANALIEIGDNNIIREYTAIQKPCYRDITKIGNRVYLMQGVHVPHDAHIEDDVVITPMVAMGGIVRVMKGANLALGVTLHQYSVIGPYSIVGMGAAIIKNLKPFARFVPGKDLSVNEYAIKKFGFESIQDEIRAYVTNGTAPSDEQLTMIVNEFDQHSRASGRKNY